MNKKKLRDALKLVGAIICSPIYLPHFLLYLGSNRRDYIISDIAKNRKDISLNLGNNLNLLYLLHNNSYYRTLFYYRIGKGISSLISWYRPGNRYFNISSSTKIGKGVSLYHPYGTIINAESIGDNFSCLQLTTLGGSYKGRPIIGNNVSLAAHVVVVGNVNIGNNVEVGAGSVVVKDIPDNVLAVGNPAKPVREREVTP